VIKAEVLVDYTVKENLAERVAKRVGMSFGAGAMRAGLGTNQGGWHWK
jgi:protease-4